MTAVPILRSKAMVIDSAIVHRTWQVQTAGTRLVYSHEIYTWKSMETALHCADSVTCKINAKVLDWSLCSTGVPVPDGSDETGNALQTIPYTWELSTEHPASL